jgi:hypothetical protein
MGMPTINKRLAIEITLAVIAVLALTSAGWNWYHPTVKTVTQTQYQTVPQEKKVETIKRVTVPGPERIVTIEKPVVVEKLGLPPAIAADPTKEIVANGEIMTHDGDKVSTVAVMDTPADGTPATVSIIAKEQPPSLFGLPNDWEMGVRYGLGTRAGQEGNINARWQFFRLGNIYLGAYGEIGTRPEAKMMLDVSMRF